MRSNDPTSRSDETGPSPETFSGARPPAATAASRPRSREQLRSGRTSLTVWLLLAMILLAGAGLRVREISRSYYGDEAYHILAARAMLEGRRPELSPGFPYTRGYAQTVAIALSMRVFGDHEASARLPSMVASIAAIPLLFVAGRRWFGAPVGLAAATLFALDPLSVQFGSWARFYAGAQMLVILAALAFERWLLAARALPFTSEVSLADPSRASPRDETPSSRSRVWVRAALWSALFLTSVGFALSLQVLTADLLLGILVYAILTLGAGAWLFGRSVLRTPEAIVIVTAAVALVVVVTALPAAYQEIQRAVTHIPVWNQRKTPALFYYVRLLRNDYPLEWFLAIVGTGFAIVRRPVTGLLTASIFWANLASHSLFFRQTSAQYFSLVFPFFFLLAACGFAYLVEAVLGVLRDRFPRRLRPAVVAALALAALSSAPWLSRSIRSESAAGYADWKGAIRELRDQIAPEDFVVAGVTDDFVPILLYLGRADAHLATESWIAERSRQRDRPRDPGHGPYDVPAWSEAAPVFERLDDHPRVWMIFATRRMSGSQVAPERAIGELVARGVTRQTAEGVTVIQLDRPPSPSP